MMEELLQIINDNKKEAPLKLMHWLHQHHVDILLEKNYKLCDFVRDFFAIFLHSPPPIYTTEEWEKLTTICFIFIISIFPPPNLIPKLPLTISYGPLFSVTLLLSSWRTPDEETTESYVQIFHLAIDYYNNGFGTKHFYSRSPISFYQLIPNILEKEFIKDRFSKELKFFLQSIPNVKDSDLNYDFISFTSEILKRIKDCPVDPQDVILAFQRIFEFKSVSSSIFLQHFFFTWFYFVKKFSNESPSMIEIFSNQIDTVTKLFSIASSLKHHELQRTFSWHLCFYFYGFVNKEEHRERILSLICNGIRRANRLDQFDRIPKNVPRFTTNLIKNYQNQNSWPMYYLLSSLESTVYSLIMNMKPIIGAASMNCTQYDLITMTKVTFAVENTGLSPLDFELYSLHPLRIFKNLEEIVPVFDLMTKYCDSIRKHVSSVALFQLSFAKNISEILKEELKYKKSMFSNIEGNENNMNSSIINGDTNNIIETDNENIAIDVQTSVPLQYLVSIVRSWTKLMIVVAHRQNVMNTYSQREIVSYPNFSPGLSAKLEDVGRLLDFTAIFKRFFDILDKCPHEFYPLFAHEIAREMFKAMKKGLITYRFVEYFRFLPIDFNNYRHSLFFNILSKMMEIAANNTDLFFSQLASSTNTLYLWIVFTIRFGASSTSDEPNPVLGILLSMYQKLFITAVLFNIKRIVNQSIALRTVTIYLKSVKRHYQTNDSQQQNQAAQNQNQNQQPNQNPQDIQQQNQNQGQQQQQQQQQSNQQQNQPADKGKKKDKRKHRPILFDEIQDSAKFEALGTMITLFIKEPKFIEIQYIMPFLAATFKIGNKELIMEASEICLKKFTIEKAKKYCASYDSIQKLFTSFFNAMNKVEFDTAKQILKIIPAYAPLYLQTPHKTFSVSKGILIDDLDFEMDLILEAVTNNLSDNPEIISSLFILITCCFESVLKKLDLPPDAYTRTINKLIILLCQCWCYDHLHPKIDSFAYYLTSAFGDAFIRGESNAFILCLLDVAGGSRSEMSKIALDMAKTFFEYLKQKKMNDKAFLMHQTIDQLLMFFPPATRLFSMLCGFSLMIRYFPTNVRLFHIRSFLVQTTDFPPLDLKFPQLVNRFLKEYLLAKPDSEKEPFMQMIYDIICPLSIGIRNVLMKRASKLGLPIPVSSMEEIEQCSTQVLMIQRLTLAFLCGLQNPFEMTPSIGAKVMEFISPRGESSSLEKLSRILSLIYSILKNDQVFQFFSLNGNLSTFLHFLCNSFLLSRYPPLSKSAKKCFTILKDKAANDPNFERQLQFIYMEPEKLFHFFSPLPERINFYVRLTKIIPNKVPPHVIKLFFSAIFEYESKRDSEKMKFLSNFIKILKFLTVSDYINRNDIRQIILSYANSEFTYLQMYLKFIAHLYEHTEIPFITLTRKYIIRFLVMFPDETIDFLMNKERSLFSFIFIEDLIIHDESKTFLMTFLNIFQQICDYSICQPELFKLVENLSHYERFASESSFLNALQKNFEKLFPIVSDQSFHHENDFTLITYTAKAIINCFQYQFNAQKVFGFCKIFSIGYFAYSDVYRKYVNIIFKNSPENRLKQLLDLLVENIHIVSPLFLDFLGPHIIRNYKGELPASLWDCLTEWLVKKEELQYAILHSFVYLLDKLDPPNESVKTLLNVMKSTISSADIRLVIYSLKIATKLSKKKFLPPEVFVAFLKQFFAFQKFSEPPYSKYFYEFLKSSPEMLNQMKFEDYNFLSFYMHHRFLHPQELQKVLSPINSVFLAAPSLVEYLPFSLITAVSSTLDNRLTNPQPGDDEEIESTFIYAANFCQIAKKTQEELDYFINVCFKYLQKLLVMNKKSEFYDKFYSLLTTSTTDEFPTNILNLIQVIDNNSFGLICCAAKIKGEILFNNYQNLVEMTLKFVENEHNSVNISFLQCFMTAIFKDSEITSKYLPVINTVFQNICKRYSSTNCDRLFIIAREIVKLDISSCQHLFQMWTFYENLKGTNADREPLLRFLIRCLEYIPSDKQISVVQMIINKIGQSKKKTHVFTTSLPYLFQSMKLSNKTKEFIVSNLIHLLLIDKLCNAEKLLAMLYEYRKEADFDTTPYMIQVLLLRAQRVNDSGSLLFIEQIIGYLPVDMKERITYLFSKLPIELWEDSFLPIIIALLTPKVKIWQPLFTLSHQFKSIGAEMVAATFSKLLDENNKDRFIRFLTNLLMYHSKARLKLTQIISGVITMFHSSRMKIPYYLAEKAIKYSGNIYQLEFFLETESVPTWRYLLPHDANDIIYGMHRPLLTTSQAAAIALTFMNEYEAAKNSYIQLIDDENSGTPIFKAMKVINNHFIAMCKNNDIPSLIQPLTTINHTNSVLVLLEKATSSYINNELKDFSILDEVTEANLNTAMRKNYLSAFEKERLTIIQAMISAISGHPQLNPDISCLNHTFVTLYQKFESLINHQPPKPDVIIEGGNPVCLLMPSMRSQFVHVCGYTTRGMVAVGKQHIDDYFNKISNKIVNNEMLPVDWRNFAAFAFNVFCVQPSSDLFSTVYGAYYRLLSQENLNYPQYIVHEACARIITLCRLAFLNNSDESSEWLQTIKNSAATVFSPMNGEHWKFWLQHIVELAKCPWFCDMAFGLFAEMSYRSCLYMMKENEWEKNKDNSKALRDALQKLVNHPSSQINMMNIVEDLFDTIFSNISFDEKLVQTKLLNFALECQKITDGTEDTIDIMSFRSIVATKATNSFQRALKDMTENQLKMIGDFPSFVRTVKKMQYEEIVKLIQNVTNSKQSIIEIRDIVSKSAQIVNDNLPFIFPVRLEKILEISILQIQDDFSVLNPNMIILQMASSMYSWKHFIVQRTNTPGGYRKSLLTLTNTMFLFKVMLQRQYSSRRRKMTIFPFQFFEIGANLILVPLISKANTIEDYFQMSMEMTSKEWIQSFTVSKKSLENNNNFDSECDVSNNEANDDDDDNNNDLVVTEEGRRSIETFPDNFYAISILESLTTSNFLKMRPYMANSIILTCLMRHIFNAPYPKMDECVFCQNSAIVPMMHSSFDHGKITDTTPKVSSCFRLSPNIVNVLGTSLDGWCIMTVAVFSKVMIKNIESVRSYIEAMIFDEDQTNNRVKTIEDILKTRTEIEARFIDFCPPRVANVETKTAEEWLDGVEKFINRATNPENQPIEAIPWF